jgi:hypothetical protein
MLMAGFTKSAQKSANSPRLAVKEHSYANALAARHGFQLSHIAFDLGREFFLSNFPGRNSSADSSRKPVRS